jgi:HAD superfamily hydrolase (TIGR01509 family)
VIQAILFDLDATLIDWGQTTVDWRDHSITCLRPIYNYLSATGHTLPSLQGFAEIYESQVYQQWSGARFPDWDAPRHIDMLKATLEHLEIKVKRDSLPHYQRLFAWSLYPGVRNFPDTLTVLQTIRQAGLKTALVTNAALPMWMRDAELASLGLLDYLDVRLTAADAGKLKPHPRPFQIALERLDVQPDEAIMVGDSLEADIAGAHAARMRGVWVKRGESGENGAVRPDAVIDSLNGLLGVLDDWYPGWQAQD